MNRWTVLLTLGLLLAAPLGFAQGEGEFDDTYTLDGIEWKLMATDPADDNDLEEGSPAEQDTAAEAGDFRALYMGESANGDILLKIHLTDVPETTTGSTFGGNGYYDVFFVGLGKEYEVSLRYYPYRDTDDDNRIYAYFYSRTLECCNYDYFGEIDVVDDTEANTFTVTIPRSLLTDLDGRLVSPGTIFSQVYATSDYDTDESTATFGLVRSEDRMPDSGVGSGQFETTYGIISSGHLSVYSPLPLRTSNGEATTFLFEVEITNDGDFLDTVHPEWSGGLESWTVTFPSGPMRLEPGESRALPFLVTVPFAHEHGVYHPFTVSFQSQSDPEARGNIELGIRYTAVAQPAGHHPEVFLHSPGSDAFFNTVEEFEPVEGEEPDTNSYQCHSGDGIGQVVPLSPRLSMGLDFDMEAEGEATWLMTADQDSNDYTINAYFVVSSGDGPNQCGIARGDVPSGAVAMVESTEPMTIRSGEVVEYTAPIIPLAEGDYVDFNENNQLYLAIRIVSPEGSTTPFGNPGTGLGDPAWEAGSKFLLPLLEYHDDVDDYFSELSGIDLYVAGNDQERYVNPGETIIYRIEATNVGVFESEFNLEITGTNTPWVQLLGDVKRIKLDPGESRELALAVAAPAGASDGEIADVVLHATLNQDESIRSIIRLLTEVDTDADHEDESAFVDGVDEELKQSPVGLLPALLVAFIALGSAVRRRRI